MSLVPPETVSHLVEQESFIAISVIIPAFNEELHIAKSLTALHGQLLAKDKFEVIVVDNGSADATVAVASGWQQSLPLRVVSKSGCSISAVRNCGAALARGRILAFLDADCMARPDWLENGLAAAEEKSIWGAPYLVPTDATWIGRIWCKYQAIQQDGPVVFLPGGNLFIAREDFLSIGGFDEIVTTSEDVEICTRARKHGMQIISRSTIGVFHEGTPRTLRAFYRQNRWHGEHVTRMFVDSLPSLQLLPIVALSVYTLLMFWAAVIAPIAAMAWHHWWLLWAPLLLLVLPAALLALRRMTALRCWLDWPQLWLLYLTYCLARASALTRVSPRSHR